MKAFRAYADEWRGVRHAYTVGHLVKVINDRLHRLGVFA